MRRAVPGRTQRSWLILVESENVLPWNPRGQRDYGKINQTGFGMPLVSNAGTQTFKKGGILYHRVTRVSLVHNSPPLRSAGHIPPSSGHFPFTLRRPLPPVSSLALKPLAPQRQRCMSHPRRIPQARRAPRDGWETVKRIDLSTSRSKA